MTSAARDAPRRLTLLLVAWLAPSSALAALKVVATVPDLAAVAAAVGGERVEVHAIAEANEDPHYVDPRPSHVVTLNRADVLIAAGMELEVGWLPRLQVQARNAKIGTGGRGFIDASTFVTPLDVPAGRVDRSMGDVHGGGNPHYTYDPRAMAQVARGIGERFAELDPSFATAHRERARRYAEGLHALAERERARFARLPETKRHVVAYHRSLTYVLDWLQLREVATIEPKPGVQPTPSHVAGVLGTMRSTGAHVIVQEEHHPTTTSNTLASLAKARVVVFRGGSRALTGEGYVEHIQTLAEELYRALQ